MFARAGYKFALRAFSTTRANSAPKSRAGRWTIASSTFAGLSLYLLSQKRVLNDAPDERAPSSDPQPENVGLSPLVWGSNQNHLISPERDSKDCIKSPTAMPELFSNPLRDLAFCIRHAACVDAAGDVYQWGDGFFGAHPIESRRPHLTLSGKNIISLAITPSMVFALSASGKIYVLASKYNRHEVSDHHKSGWNIFGRSETNPSAFKILNTHVGLRSKERFTSISAGSDHLIALTSNGRTFTHPITRLANWNGQLGLRTISVPGSGDDAAKRVSLELLPKSLRDASSNMNMPNPEPYVSNSPPSASSDEKTIGFCDRLFEVPALRNVDVGQIVAGDRTSFVVTRRDGRVLAWGANEYGQLGLGANVTLPSITVPTEVVLSKFTDRGTVSRCINITAGGDLTYFTVQRELPGSGSRLVDVLACGNGQWGGLGNASYSNAQGAPVKVKNISGILEYDDNTQSLQPLRPYHLSVAPGPANNENGVLPSSSGHVIVTLDTIPLAHPDPKSDAAADAARAPGRDVLAWGLNHHYQLGNGKRTSLSAPALVPAPSEDSGRLMCRVSQGRVLDFKGGVVGRNMRVEQRAVAGPGVSVVYWKIV